MIVCKRGRKKGGEGKGRKWKEKEEGEEGGMKEWRNGGGKGGGG